MELVERVGNLEKDSREIRDRLTHIEARMDTMFTIFATKEDMHKEFNAQTWKIIGAIFTVAGIALAAAKLIH